MIRELNRFKWFGSRPVMYLDNPGAGGGGGSGAGTGGGGAGGGTGTGGGDAGGGTGGGAGAGGAGGGTGGGTGGAAGAAAGTTIDWKTAPENFRKGYEELRAKYEPFEKLGLGADQLASHGQNWGRVTEVALDLGDQLAELGKEYTEEEILEMLAERPLDTINFLQDKLAKLQEEGGGGGGDDQDLEAAIEAGIDRRMGPIEKRENERITKEANLLFERTCRDEFTKVFKEEGVDVTKVAPEEMFMLISATSEIFKYNLEDIHALKHEGKTAPVQKAVRDAKALLDKYFISRASRERGDVAGGAGRGAGGGAGGRDQQIPPGFLKDPKTGQIRRANLDELSERPELIGQQYK